MSHSFFFKVTVLLGLATAFASCSRDEIYSDSEKSKVSLSLHHLDIEQDAITRASGDQDPHRIVFKAFDASNAVAYQTVQASGQEGFGVLDFELSPGAYTFVAVAHDLSSAALAADEGGNVAASLNSAQEAVHPEANVADCFGL